MDGGTFAFGLYAPLGNLFQAQTNKYETLSYIHHRVQNLTQKWQKNLTGRCSPQVLIHSSHLP